MRKSKMFLALMMCFPVLAANAAESQYFDGSGGKGKSIAILSPEAAGFAEDQTILLIAVQGELVSNFSTYSAIDVLDRANLHEQYKELSSGIYNDDAAEAIGNLGNLPPTEYIMSGRITKIGDKCNLQLRITKTADKMMAASYSGSVAMEELSNLTAVRQASLFLLEKIGVTPTAKAKTELSGAAESNRVDAQFSLARGITAQRQGTEVAALSYFYQAAALDPSLLEAAGRSSVMSASISSGNIGADTRNDILWRRDWVARLTEAEQFFSSLFNENSLPYTLFYSTKIIPGDIDYKTETQTLIINTNLHAPGAWIWLSSVEKALQAVYDGLDATKRKKDWELDGWPWRGVTELNPFENKRKTFSIAAELVSDKGTIIGRASFESKGEWRFNRHGRPEIHISDDDRKQVRFANVKADDITDRITIRIANVNGVDAHDAARTGVLQVKAISEAEWDRYVLFRMGKGGITGYNGKGSELVIPGSIWGESVTTIGESAFAHKQLISVIIPNSVKYIGNNAFAYNNITRITIGGNVEVHENAFHRGFSKAYNRSYTMSSGWGERRAGTYTPYGNENWSLNMSEEDSEKDRKHREDRIEDDIKMKKWIWSGSVAGGVPFMMNSVDTIYNSVGLLLALNGELFRADVDFIRIGVSIEGGLLLNNENAVREIHPDVKNMYPMPFFKLGASVRLYPADVWYLSGVAGFGHYYGYDAEMHNGDRFSGPGTSAAVFSAGTGLILFPSNEVSPFLEAQYHMLPFNAARYLSINIGAKFGR